MLGTEPEIIENHVKTGEVQLVFWPVLNHGNPSTFSHLTAECVAQQSMDAFWEIHHTFFENARDLWSADRDYFVRAAIDVGVDQATFETCYDGGSGLEALLELDALRREASVYSQPVFDINGERLAGAQSYDLFAQVFSQLLNNSN